MNPKRETRFQSGLYAVAALLIVAPAIDMLGATWPVRPTEIGWRFGSLGLGFGSVIIQIVGLALAMAIAAQLGHRRILRTLSGFGIVAAAAIVAGIVRFILDYGWLRSAIPSPEQAAFDATALRALIVASLAVPVLVVLGGKGWMASGESAEPPLQRRPERPRVIPFPKRKSGVTGWKEV